MVGGGTYNEVWFWAQRLFRGRCCQYVLTYCSAGQLFGAIFDVCPYFARTSTCMLVAWLCWLIQRVFRVRKFGAIVLMRTPSELSVA